MFNNKGLQLVLGIVLIVLALTGCGRKKFDRREWDAGDGISWPNRNGMLDDLLATHKLKGMKYKEVINLLRYPQWNSYTDKSFQYEINRKMDKLDTVYSKYLVLYLNQDSVVSDIKVVEKDNSDKLAIKHKLENEQKKKK
ncbi:hypothetical protein [Mucilaginibacter glaciei]|uniref:Uncharacterized protein n=1 Tax=Mucilaginibacter glaciei TaxID=2772109 RepID=A0A926NPW4_9SPHI|nr:hypothetical protein [Mucilaginibacter glaciei]MBD1393736.1 hypothetical protein [Mucilaginibacter glaciei]